MKIILAFDSFKGCASSQEIATAARNAILCRMPDCQVAEFAIADGGEGTADAICSCIDSKKILCRVHDPLMMLIDTHYNIINGNVAVMEMAAASGLTLVPAEKRNPEVTSTYGTGEMIADAIARGCRTIILGIGGSATNDAAIGLLRALGFRFLTADGEDTSDLRAIASVDDSCVSPDVLSTKFIVACDVNNPFYGINGAAYVYAPQKGATPQQVIRLDEGLRNFANIVKQYKNIDLQKVHGSGAAGGMGGGLLAFLSAELKPGIDTILEMIGFDKELDGASLVLTGEGKIDRQSAMGKAIGGIINHASKYSVPVVALGGSVDSEVDCDSMGLASAFSIIQSPVSLQEAMDKATALLNVERTVNQIIGLIIHCKAI